MRAWEDNIRRVVPYVPGEQPNVEDMVKLNTNENPYPPAPGVQKLSSELDVDCLRLYPAPDCKSLCGEIASYYNVKPEQVFVGVGSDDVISMAFLTFFNSDKPILFPDITYSFYNVWGDVYRIPYEEIPVDNNFKIIKEDYYKENGGIIFPNPNAPTGILESLEFVEDILKNNQDVVVIVDEAYIDFGGKSALELIDKYENLLVVQTFSKSRSMAGMRIGFAIGNERLIKALNDVKFSINSYTMNQYALKVGTEAVRDREYFESTVQRIIKTREEAKVKLRELGFEFPDSMSNFIFATHKKYPAKEIFEYLKTKNIFVRYFSADRINNYLRITIGTDEEMNKLYEALEAYIGISQ